MEFKSEIHTSALPSARQPNFPMEPHARVSNWIEELEITPLLLIFLCLLRSPQFISYLSFNFPQFQSSYSFICAKSVHTDAANVTKYFFFFIIDIRNWTELKFYFDSLFIETFFYKLFLVVLMLFGWGIYYRCKWHQGVIFWQSARNWMNSK